MPANVEKNIGDINSGVSKDGEAFFFIPTYSKLSSIRWKFDAEDTANNDADLKKFDITIPLEK